MRTDESAITVACIVRDSVGSIEQFHSQLSFVLANEQQPVQILYIDDGSLDGTADALANIAKNDGRVRVLRLSRPFGEQASAAAALTHAGGQAAILLWGLHSPADVLPMLLSRWREGFDVVWGAPPRLAAGWRTRLSRLASGGSRLPSSEDVVGGLFTRRVLDVYRELPHRDEDLVATLYSYGFRQTAITIPEQKSLASRKAEPSVSTILARLVDYSIIPVRLIGALGLLLGVLAIGFAMVIVIRWYFFGLGALGWRSTISALLFLGSIQLISLSIILEYIWRIFRQTRQVPRYVIKEQIGRPLRPLQAAWNLDPRDLDVSGTGPRW